MNVLDSSAWLEVFADGPNAATFAEVMADVERLVVPVITVYEVFKRILQQRGESAALEAVALMRQGRVVALDQPVALRAATISLEYSLPMADALIYAVCLEEGATLWTQDRDFESIPGVRFFAKG